MNKKLLLFITFLSGIYFSSCQKDQGLADLNKQAGRFTDLKVPEGFLWESSREVKLKIAVSDTRFGDALHIIAVYSSKGKLITKGAAKPGSPFESKVSLPNTEKELFIVKTAPDQSTLSQKAEVSGTELNVSLGSSPALLSSLKSSAGTLSQSPDCTTGCDLQVNLTQNQTVTISGGKTVCVKGSNKTFSVEFERGGGTLRICGNGLIVSTLSNNKINDPMKIVITSGSDVTFDPKNNKATNFNQNNNTFENYGTVTFEGGINLAGTLTNNGVLNVRAGQYSTETQTDPATVHTNNGTITIEGGLDVGSNSIFYNNGQIKTTDFRVFNHATFYNNCKIWVTNEYDHSTLMKNYGYIRVDKETFINGQSELAQYAGAILNTRNIKINGTIKGYNSASLVKVGDATELTGAGLITGQIKYCDENGIEKNNGTISDGASLSCDIYIPASGCSEGFGSAPIIDSDGDGVPDNLDDYPNDASMAFNNYYIDGGADAGATVAFEDMWPLKGDYDMNDVVVSYQLKVVTNALNKVVVVEGYYNLYARGGIFQNGFGIEFPVSRSAVSNVVGGTLEEGQQKAVIILFTNMHAEMFYMNTREEEPLSPPVPYTISFKVNNGPTLSEFGLSEYNPFIWNRSAGRGYEVHLPGKTPTSLANTNLFGTGDDRSNPSTGKYYVTEEGYPWGISIPIKHFIYPIEGKDIITAYLKLPEWISSGGTNYSDWYASQSTGYRNTTNLFSK